LSADWQEKFDKNLSVINTLVQRKTTSKDDEFQLLVNLTKVESQETKKPPNCLERKLKQREAQRRAERASSEWRRKCVVVISRLITTPIDGAF